MTRWISANTGSQPAHTLHKQSAGQLKCKCQRSAAEKEHKNSHPRKHLENTFLWLIGGLLFHPFISFPSCLPPEGICFPLFNIFYCLEEFGKALVRRRFFSVRAGETIFLLCELRQADIREERALGSMLWNGALYKTHGLGVLYTYYKLQQSFCTQQCINIETRPAIPLIKMKALKESDVPSTRCYANRSALLNWIHSHLIGNLCNLCWTASTLNALQIIPTEHFVVFSK